MVLLNKHFWKIWATASSIAAALLSYYTIAQVDGLLAGKLGVTEADGGADEVKLKKLRKCVRMLKVQQSDR